MSPNFVKVSRLQIEELRGGDLSQICFDTPAIFLGESCQVKTDRSVKTADMETHKTLWRQKI